MLMQRYLKIFIPIQLLFGMIVNVYAAGTGSVISSTSAEAFGFIILILAGIGMLYRLNLRNPRLKPVRIKKRRW